MSKRTYRLLQSTLFMLSVFILMASFYFQYVVGLRPCPLCMMQRIVVFFLFMFCLMGMCLSTIARGKFVGICQLFFSACGLLFATRQMWLQSLSEDQVPTCLPDLDILFRYFPWRDVVHALLWGAGDCAEVSWQWLGLTMPGWAALYFLFMFFASGFILYKLMVKQP